MAQPAVKPASAARSVLVPPLLAKGPAGVEQVLRRIFDVIFSLAGLVALAPAFAVIALAIKLDDGGPVLYSHPRVGKALRPFRFLKFRSMIAASAAGSPVTAPRDVRITRVGRFLRKYKLDELPQLVNVLRGEMRFVGVRPQLEKHVEIFREEYEELLQSPPRNHGPRHAHFPKRRKVLSRGVYRGAVCEKNHAVKIAIRAEIFEEPHSAVGSGNSVSHGPRPGRAIRRMERRANRSGSPILDGIFLAKFLTGCPRKFSAPLRSRGPSIIPQSAMFHFSATESDPSHQNDELDKIPPFT